ncbi:ferredoxin [Mycolicibacterium komossense]|uniref:Ferredoxin n=1 Tax=Mycolicibacterium komossense TaxID=1779 RepID=A0ABT3CL63_9MYCO|nr:ferredoxin [Mycolicibacterium komossense]MCV7230112.1 ferredoxin [Mycolicibacterium komossense]
MAKVLADRDICIGAGMCVMTAEAVFDQDDEALVVVLTDEVPEDEQKRVDDAVRLCPSGALSLRD